MAMSEGSSAMSNRDGEEDDRTSALSLMATNGSDGARSSFSLLPPSSPSLWLGVRHGLPLSGGGGEGRALGL